MRDILRRHSFTIAFLAILIVSAFLFTDNDEDIQQWSGTTMGTTYQLQIVDMPAERTAL